MLQPFRSMLDKSFLILLAALAAIAFSLFTIFHFLSFSQLDEPQGLTLFIMVACLLLACYVLGFIAIAFFGLFVLTEFWHRDKK
jgi:Na+/H+-dicarboxylate symporter